MFTLRSASRSKRASVTLRRSLSSNAEGIESRVQHLHPCVRDLARDIAQTQPCIQLAAKDVNILSQPVQFLDLLLDMIRRAERRIFLSSLYMGSAEKRLLTAIEHSLKTRPGLHVHLVLDYNRSTRPGPTSTVSLLLPLLRMYPERVHINLFKSPKLKGLLAKIVPRRFDEGWGTWHAKVYGVDNELIISGANLNQSYFTNRQDRYLHFQSAAMSEYCYSFLQTISQYSFQLRQPGDAESSAPYNLVWPNRSVAHERMEASAGASLDAFQVNQLQQMSQSSTESSSNVSSILVFPIIQGGQFGIREEERTLAALFSCLNASSTTSAGRPLVDLTSGYFGLYKPYRDLVRKSQLDCRILAASPRANGFYGSRGISGRIPEGYTLLERRFWNAIRKDGRAWDGSRGVQLQEWVREGWTYHAKGIWVSPRSASDDESFEPPVMTLFGSTNLNSRSANLDTELAFVMLVPTTDGTVSLRNALSDEVRNLRTFATPWLGEQRRVRLGTKALVSMVGGML